MVRRGYEAAFVKFRGRHKLFFIVRSESGMQTWAVARIRFGFFSLIPQSKRSVLLRKVALLKSKF